MSSSAAADEFARMTSGSKGEGSLPHPEDRLEHSKDKQSDYPQSDSNSTGTNSDIEDKEEDEIDDVGNSSDDSHRKPSSSKKTTYIHKKTGSIAPSIRPASSIIDTMPQYRLASYGAANTGPKGVLADARSFEIAKRREMQARQAGVYGRKTSIDLPSGPAAGVQARLLDERMRHSDNSDDDDELMQAWRQKRLEELKAGSSFNRRKVATGRRYGKLEAVDANGYLDAIEKVTADTVVIVLIYDERSSESQFVEDCIGTLARRHVATRFVKLHYSEAEMDRQVVPALLGYKAGELIVNLPRVIDEIPTGRTLSSESLESLLKNALTGESSKSSNSLTSVGSRTSLYNWDDD
ncbi:phosducin [Drechslerella dactyloides]|uniref:Phosducin n=1 Tax=Drechslerella dactyloides TaxID=74499 RepID=A0AAD6J014_DREDA|nr:phosducin [Drechslerella dactyloides]